MHIAVLNASGVQARAIADHLSRHHAVRRISRSGGEGSTVVDPASEDDLARALQGMDAAVLTSPIDHRAGVREFYASRVTRAAERAGLKRLVLNTAAPVLDIDRPVATVLKAVRSIVQSGRTPATIVQPTTYLDNLTAPWALPGLIDDGVLAYPIAPDTAVSWISHADLARFIGAAIASDEAAHQVYDLGGPDSTGPELAARIAAAAGRSISYQPLAPDDFAHGINAAFGASAGDDIADMYRHLAAHPDAFRRDPSPWARFGLVPESLDDWVRRHSWTRA